MLSVEENNKIIVTARNKKLLQELAAGSLHKNVFPVEVNMEFLDEQSDKFYHEVSGILPDIDILINNAGSLIVKDFLESDITDARRVMETNFFGPATVIRTLYPLMKKGTHIINISSMGGYQGSMKFKGLSYYSASKAAISCLTECIAEELKGTGIIINCLALGSVQTEMFEKAFPGFKASVSSAEMATYITGFALNGNKFFNGKVIPVAGMNP